MSQMLGVKDQKMLNLQTGQVSLASDVIVGETVGLVWVVGGRKGEARLCALVAAS